MRVPLEWLKEFVEIRMKPEKLAHLLTMSGLEVESVETVGKDQIFEINITPNRADCLSILGVAREVAALTGAKLKDTKLKPLSGSGRMAEAVKITVKQKAKCPRYSARIIRGVRIAPSPPWLAARLAACGVRSINNVVDATNYVMLERGQPLHAFDLARLRGAQVVVDVAAPRSSFTTLDGVVRLLTEEDLLIRDGERAIALAGVMGGENTEVSDTTTDLLLESAFFAPSGVRRTSRRLGLSTESSRRFERGIDANGVALALARLTALIVELAGGTPTADSIDVAARKVTPVKIPLSVDETNRMLGTTLTAPQVSKLLKQAGLAVTGGTGAKMTVTIPSARVDLTRPIDLIEEVARLHGYDRIEATMPKRCMASIARPRFFEQELIAREALSGAGLHEAALYGFTARNKIAAFEELAAHAVAITNPLSQDEGVMATTLLPGLLDALRVNISRQRLDLRLFALQHVFHRPGAAGPSEEPRMLSGVLTGKRFANSWERAREVVDFYDAKGAVETVLSALGLLGDAIVQRGDAPSYVHPGHFAYVLVRGQRVGVVGQLHPEVAARWEIKQDVYAFELHFESLAERALAVPARFRELNKFPFSTRDVAIVIDERIPLVEVEKTISDSSVKFLDDVRLFDLYRGKGIPEGKKSLALTLRFSRDDATITDEEVVVAMNRIVGSLQSKLGATLRE